MINYCPSRTNLSLFVKENVKTMQKQALSKSIIINIALNQDLYVIADKDMLSTVLRNLLSNAIKFTSDGGHIEISWELLNHSTHNEVQLCIADTGIGIDADALEKIFQIDYSTQGTKTEKGTGLGLILCKEFMEKQKGSIRAESSKNKGSKFIVTLPFSD